MAAITKVGTPSIGTLEPPATCQKKSKAGEALAAGDVVYRKASDGLFYKAGAASDGEAFTAYEGMVLVATDAGEACTAFTGIEVPYGSGMTVNARVFLGATAGGLVDAAGANGNAQIGKVISATKIYLFPLRPIAAA